MNCQQMTQVIHGYLDQELDPVRSLETEEHLKQCPACSQGYQAQQALRKVIADRSLSFEAPRGLAQRLRAAVRQAARAEAPPSTRAWELGRLWLRWLAPAAVVALVLVLALPTLVAPSADSRLAREVISAHVRSLMADHLSDVASTDQHTVKPWFNGKLTVDGQILDNYFDRIASAIDQLKQGGLMAEEAPVAEPAAPLPAAAAPQPSRGRHALSQAPDR